MDAHFFPFNWIVDETEEKPPLLSAGFFMARHMPTASVSCSSGEKKQLRQFSRCGDL